VLQELRARVSLPPSVPHDVKQEPPPASAAGTPFLRHQLRQRLPAWRAAGASPQVLSWISEGARCEWLSGPPPRFDHGVSFTGQRALTAEQWAFFEKERLRHYETGAWEDAPMDERSHVSRAHLVPKKVGPGEPPKWRIVWDLRPLNAFCRPMSCRYETLKVLGRLAQRGDWMFSWDLKDGYHAIGVHREHRRYMTIAIPPPPGSPPDAPPRYIRSAALPFGWNASPYIFTKVMRVMLRLLRAPTAVSPRVARLRTRGGRAFRLRLGAPDDLQAHRTRGIRCLGYVDDFLACCSTRREALLARERAAEVMRRLGIARHETKGVWEPTQRLEHLGLDVDSRQGLFRIPPVKLKRLEDQAGAIRALAAREARLVPARLLAGFIGYAQSVELACPMARFYLRSLHDVLATRANWDARVRLSRQALRDLLWWRSVGGAQVSRAIWRAPNERTLHCDASRLAWGGVLDNTVPASGMWTGRTRGRHINYLELLAVDRTLSVFESELRGQHVLLWEDNTTVMHVLNNRTTRSPELMHLLRRVHHHISALGIDLEVRWIASEENSQADALSRGSPFDGLELRSETAQALNRRFGAHVVDRYATASNAKAPVFNSLLPEPTSAGTSALSQEWRGVNNLVFPPPAELPRVAQLLAEVPAIMATVVAPYWPAQHWYQRLLSVAASVDTHALTDIATPPAWLPGSARTALSGAMLSIFRVEARQALPTGRPSAR
jgi:hypothetical protein